MSLDKNINKNDIENEEMNSFLDWLIEKIKLQDDELMEQLLVKDEE